MASEIKEPWNAHKRPKSKRSNGMVKMPLVPTQGSESSPSRSTAGCGPDLSPFGAINLDKPLSERDPEMFTIEWGDFDDFVPTGTSSLGEGSYGQVTAGRQLSTGREVALKYIKPEKLKMKSLRREVKMLLAVRGGPNVIEFIDIVRDPVSDQVVLAFELIRDVGCTDGRMFLAMSSKQKKQYLYKVLTALEYTHSKGIIHCDLKAGNILYNPANGDVRVIDFAFGTYYHPDDPMRRFPGTRTWKAPEMMLRHEGFSFPVDMWAFGCLACLVLLGHHPFRGDPAHAKRKVTEDYPAHMERIMYHLGTEELVPYVEKYNITVNNTTSSRGIDLRAAMAAPRTRRRPFGRHLSKKQYARLEKGIDLIDALLVYDHHARPTSTDLLSHPYFDGMP